MLPLGPLDPGGDQLGVTEREFVVDEALSPPTRVAGLPVEHRVDQFAAVGPDGLIIDLRNEFTRLPGWTGFGGGWPTESRRTPWHRP